MKTQVTLEPYFDFKCNFFAIPWCPFFAMTQSFFFYLLKIEDEVLQKKLWTR